MTQSNVPVFEQADIEQNKTMAGLAYIIFFLPLIVCPNSQYAKFHANQGLLNLLAAIGLSIVGSILAITIIVPILTSLAGIVVFVFSVMGLINGFKGVAKRMPLYGSIDIIK